MLLVPFEMAVLDGGARSVMHSYTEIDGVPVAADPDLLTGLLRDQWGFDGTVVADYFGVAFLHLLHHVAADLGEAAAQALAAGVDVELPTGRRLPRHRSPPRSATGAVDEALVDRAVLRVLRQKEELGLLDATFDDEPPTGVDLDSPEHRALARRLAEESVVLLAQRRHAAARRPGARIAVIGPNADRAEALFGCYSFVNHVLAAAPRGRRRASTCRRCCEALRSRVAGADVAFAPRLRGRRRRPLRLRRTPSRPPPRPTSRSSSSATRPGSSAAAPSARAATATTSSCPACSASSSRRCSPPARRSCWCCSPAGPYAVGWALERCAAVVQAFFPGEEGAGAIAGVLSGRVNPSGRLPVSLPRSAGAQPYTYLHPALGGDGDVTNLATTPGRCRSGTGCRTPRSRHDDLDGARRHRRRAGRRLGCG